MFFCLLAQAQRTPLVEGEDGMHLVTSTRFVITNQSLERHYNAIYKHKGNTLSSDSSDWYRDDIEREFFEAYGNVVITQPSGTTIYCDKLHYEAATQLATLTKNVRVVDGSSVLTTNYMTYNFRDQRGTYTGGGRIVNQGDTITSKNAYYFERTKDSYFRNQVVVRTEETTIYTDTMRYNSITKETVFFGPTNIKGNEGENLYTESGTYNTGTGIAKFNKNNLYTSDSKFLKGDSLYYDRSIGDGEAFRNVLFVDTLDKFYGSGGYGKYKREDESITLTDNPLVMMVVRKDSTQNQTDSVETEMPDEQNLSRRERRRLERERENEIENQQEIKTDLDSTQTNSIDSLNLPRLEPQVDTAYLTADTLFSKMILVKEYQPLDLQLNRDGGQLDQDDDNDYGDDEGGDEFGDEESDDGVESSEQIIKKEDEGEGIIKVESMPDSLLIDTTGLGAVGDVIEQKLKIKAPIIPPPKVPDSLTIDQTLKADSVLRIGAPIPKGNEAEELMAGALMIAQTPDTLLQDSSVIYADTARTRIVKAYHHVRMYKSDFQAVSDSAYYGMLDSMFRFMGRPMIWAEESQISGDTIYMQMINQQVDNALLKGNAFMVNSVLDTVKFNQLKGRKITAFFKDSYVERLFVDGNAENLSFSVDEKTKIITEMFHDRSARIKMLFKDKEIDEYISMKRAQAQIYPFKMVTQENEILPGFLWRPQDRPKSKEDMMNRKREEFSPPQTEDEESKSIMSSEEGSSSENTADKKPIEQEIENSTITNQTEKEEELQEETETSSNQENTKEEE